MQFFFFQAGDGILGLVRSRGLGDLYKRQDQGGPGNERARDRARHPGNHHQPDRTGPHQAAPGPEKVTGAGHL